MQFCVIHKESLIAHKMLLIPTAYNIYSTVQKDKLSENYVYWMVLLLLLTDMKMSGREIWRTMSNLHSVIYSQVTSEQLCVCVWTIILGY